MVRAKEQEQGAAPEYHSSPAEWQPYPPLSKPDLHTALDWLVLVTFLDRA
jgi:hypothetical protein